MGSFFSIENEPAPTQRASTHPSASVTPSNRAASDGGRNQPSTGNTLNNDASTKPPTSSTLRPTVADNKPPNVDYAQNNVTPSKRPLDAAPNSSSVAKRPRTIPQGGLDEEHRRFCVRCPKIYWLSKKEITKVVTNAPDVPEPVALHKIARWPYFFATFRAIDSEAASTALSKIEFRGERFEVTDASLPSQRRARSNENVAGRSEHDFQRRDAGDVTAPWGSVPYSEQKTRMIRAWSDALIRVQKRMMNNKDVRRETSWLWKLQSKDLVCPLEDSVFCEEQYRDFYRNKNEFTVGISWAGGSDEALGHVATPTVGYALGMSRDGDFRVGAVSAEKCLTTSKIAMKVASALEEVVKNSGQPVYNRKNHEGYWRLITVRNSTRTNQVIVIVLVCAQGALPKSHVKTCDEKNATTRSTETVPDYKVPASTTTVVPIKQETTMPSSAVCHDSKGSFSAPEIANPHVVERSDTRKLLSGDEFAKRNALVKNEVKYVSAQEKNWNKTLTESELAKRSALLKQDVEMFEQGIMQIPDEVKDDLVAMQIVPAEPKTVSSDSQAISSSQRDTHASNIVLDDAECQLAVIARLQKLFEGGTFGLHWQRSDDLTPSPSTTPMEHVYGLVELEEELLGLRLHIHPSAFFQVNTVMAERLYNVIRDWARVTKDTTVLDVCCGTGTIALSMAKHARAVFGVELSAPAISSAKKNARLNNITNATFIAGAAEKVIGEVMQLLPSNLDCVAVLDPPRDGVAPSVISAVRGAEKVKRIVYVACKPKNAWKNIMQLCRPTSKAFRRKPFRPVRAIGVDLFPHTPHGELVILLERCE